MRHKGTFLLAVMSFVFVLGLAACARESVPTTEPAVSEAPKVGEVTLSGADGSN